MLNKKQVQLLIQELRISNDKEIILGIITIVTWLLNIQTQKSIII